MCVCYRPPGQKELDDNFFRQVEKASRLWAEVLMGKKDHSDACSKDNISGHKIFLVHTDGQFLIQVIEGMKMEE